MVGVGSDSDVRGRGQAAVTSGGACSVGGAAFGRERNDNEPEGARRLTVGVRGQSRSSGDKCE